MCVVCPHVVHVMSSHRVYAPAGGAPTLGARASSTPAPAFGGGAFGGAASGPSPSPNPFQPAPCAAGGGASFGQQQSAATGFGAINPAGTYSQCDPTLFYAHCLFYGPQLCFGPELVMSCWFMLIISTKWKVLDVHCDKCHLVLKG